MLSIIALFILNTFYSEMFYNRLLAKRVEPEVSETRKGKS